MYVVYPCCSPSKRAITFKSPGSNTALLSENDAKNSGRCVHDSIWQFGAKLLHFWLI